MDVIRVWFYSHFLKFHIVRLLERLFIFAGDYTQKYKESKLNEKESNVGLRYKARGN